MGGDIMSSHPILGLIIIWLILFTITVFVFKSSWFQKIGAKAAKNIKESKEKKQVYSLANFHPHCLNCGYELLNNESKCPNCGIDIQISKEELEKQQRIYLANNNGFGKAANVLQSTSNNLTKTGKNMSHAGCLMTIFITIPILIILYFIF